MHDAISGQCPEQHSFRIDPKTPLDFPSSALLFSSQCPVLGKDQHVPQEMRTQERHTVCKGSKTFRDTDPKTSPQCTLLKVSRPPKNKTQCPVTDSQGYTEQGTYHLQMQARVCAAQKTPQASSGCWYLTSPQQGLEMSCFQRPPGLWFLVV